MKLKNITDALNHYYLDKFPNAKGWFIGKSFMEPTKINLYKKFRIEIYYHIPGKNHLAYQCQLIDRCPEGAEEEIKERLLVTALTDLFKSLQDLDKYETV